MKYKLNEEELELMKRVSKTTITNYFIDNEGYIEIDSLMCAIDDLYREVDYQKEQYEDLKNDMEGYYELKKEWRDNYE